MHQIEITSEKMNQIKISREQLEYMLIHQNSLNNKMAGSEWDKNPRIKPYRAAWVECAELMGWLDWEWWKKTEYNHNQCLIELVDIFHFLLSTYLQSPETKETIMNNFFIWDLDGKMEIWEEKGTSKEKQIENLIVALIRGYLGDSMLCFFQLLASFGESWEFFVNLYYGKGVLNRFRIDNGYKEGTYIKIWCGIEDNEHMIQFLKKHDITELYAFLEKRYGMIKNREKTLNPEISFEFTTLGDK